MSSKKGLSFPAHFVKPNEDPFQLFQWKKVKSEIKTPQGNVVFSMEEVHSPEEWSQTAIDIAASKYFRKTGVPQTSHENSVQQMVSRVARSIRQAGEDQGGYFSSTKDAEQFEKELSFILLSQRGAFNSPVFFNCGLYKQYGIIGPSGQWHWDSTTESAVESTNAYEYPQCSACFIQKIDDSLKSIFSLIQKEAQVFKYGSGSGTNFSSLRGKQEKLSNGGYSSGLISFLEVFDRAAGATKSGGTTRRAAKMVCVDIDHPEIVDFIHWKEKEEKKAQALIAAGFDADFNGEAYKTVSGQNSNNSVRIPDSFMHALENDQTWQTITRSTKKVVDTYKAKDLWQMIGNSAWACADPGVQFTDNIQAWHTCSNSGSINASNPCSEYMFLDDTACNLASLNLAKFLNEQGEFETQDFVHTCKTLFVAQEILIDHSGYPTPGIAENSHSFRPLGLGYTNLGALLITMGIPYDSKEARDWAANITALMTGTAYAVSAEMAELKGVFKSYPQNQASMLAVMQKHYEASTKLSAEFVSKDLHATMLKTWSAVKEKAHQVGFRNSQATVIAPTGTIALLMDCDTTGIEPEFSLLKEKKLSGGGKITIVNRSVKAALQNLGYSTSQIENILQFIAKTGSIEGSPELLPEHLPIFDCAIRAGANGSRFIKPQAHLKMMAVIQPFLSGAISKTVNLPEEATAEEILKIYYEAWKMGLKAISVYRDKSKSSQPLNVLSPKKSTEPPTKSSTSPACPICSHPTVNTGSCLRCTNCGHSLSCS